MNNHKKPLFHSFFIVIVFFLLPALFYAGLITNFNFNLLAYEDYWKAYNELALSILDGRLNISMESVGPEGLYYEDKIYMYYGFFPTILRLILAPFIDLNTIPLGKLSVWIMTTLGASALQYAILFSTAADKHHTRDIRAFVILLGYSLLIWFGSAYFIIAQKGNILHEPYAAMLMVSSIFIAVVWHDIFRTLEKPLYRLALYALIAAFSLHTRQTIAISLYAATIVLIFASTLDVHHSKTKSYNVFNFQFVSQLFKTSYVPLLILGASGIVLLTLNYLRFGEFWNIAGGQWGYARAEKVHTASLCSAMLTDTSRFEIARILPNLHFYINTNIPLHNNWINDLGLGYIRKEWPFSYLKFLWIGSLFIFIYFVLLLIYTNIKDGIKNNYKLNLLFLSLMIGPLLLLSYLTVAFRYVADLWPPVMLAFLFTYQHLSRLHNHPLYNRYYKFVLPLFILVISLNLYRSWFIYTKYPDNSNLYEKGMPSVEILERLRNPPEKEWDIERCIKEYDITCSVSNTEKQQYSDCRFGRFRLRSQSQDFQPE